MADRSWFYASEGQQKGPFPESQLHDFIARGTVGPDTLVWTEGMSGWQKAGEVPGLIPDSSDPLATGPGSTPTVGAASYTGGALSIDFEVWEITWRTIVLWLGLIFIIPTPWVIVMYCRWIVSSVHVPGRPNLSFTGQPLTLFWYFAAVALFIAVAMIGSEVLNNLMLLVQIALYWLLIKWFVANIAANGQPLGLSFSGSIWAYLGWNIFVVLSVITIIGWAWVYTAQVRWICRNIDGTRREVIFKASGLDMLWRTIVFAIGCAFLIPIPWALRWYTKWYVSQFALIERSTLANA
ncbi:DUF4339 domain-containing protein [Bradyrhizobium cenepequi]|uniref:DUF4339 domain-containing protein n=1 Tax=Bradyrhizobium cenepequi TaxID=2821403 RepID=UPI001CE38B83|nr:DUF4339 domain-containing protein [Bradyrhizobium cenepequi]MCA6111443.1 DUF4339 domain-containing protein [Bradyrhizobium cenepequi]